MSVNHPGLDLPADEPSEARLVRELADSGRVTIGTSGRGIALTFGISIAVVVGVFSFAYLAGEMEGGAAIFGMIVIPLFLGGLWFLFYRMYAGKQLTIETAGLTTLDGQFIPWSDIDRADVFRSFRSEPAVRIHVSQSAWDEYLANRSIPGRWLNTFNEMVTRKQGIYLPAQMREDNDDIVTLINFFAAGRQNPN